MTPASAPAKPPATVVTIPTSVDPRCAMSGSAPARRPVVEPTTPLRTTSGTDHWTSNSCTSPVTLWDVSPRARARESRQPKSTGTAASSASRASRRSPSCSSPGSCAMRTRPRHHPRRIAVVSQRVVRPYSLSAESSRPKASAGDVVPRRTRTQTPRLSGATRCCETRGIASRELSSANAISARCSAGNGTTRVSSSRSFLVIQR